eukprot:366580_1
MLPVLVRYCNVLNWDQDESQVSTDQIITTSIPSDHTKFIISDCDPELLILVEFEKEIELKNMTIYSLPVTCIENKNEENDGDDINASQPKTIHIYKTKSLNVDFNDIATMKPSQTVTCSPKKLGKGHRINLQKRPVDAVNFKKVQYLIIYIQNNQNDSEHTYVNGITFNTLIPNMHKHRNSYPKFTYSKPITFDTTDTENTIQLNNYFDSTDENDMKQTYNSTDVVATTLKYNCSQNSCDIINCNHFCNLMDALQQYDGLSHNSLIRNDNHILDKIYKNGNIDLVNDFEHILSIHAAQFDAMYDLAIYYNNNQDCSLSNCRVIRRHYSDKAVSVFDSSLDVVKQQLLDKVHCYFYHAFDVGYKVKNAEMIKMLSDKVMEMQESKDTDNIDHVLSRFRALVSTPPSIQCIDRSHKFITKGRNNYYNYSFRFFYWEYFKYITNKYDRTVNLISTFEHANKGYAVKDLYIAAKYRSLKEELLMNPICRVDKASFDVQWTKAGVHLQSQYASTFICGWKERGDSMKKKLENAYKIRVDDPIQIQHLTAILFYCNFDKLQRHFSETYRMRKYENLDDLKRRHSNFAYFGRYLREILFFGQDSYSPYYGILKKKSFTMFFHGVSGQFNFGKVTGCINGPLSTTTDWSVAVSFTAKKGVILKIRLSLQQQGLYNIAPYFDCFWISDYPCEQEKFLIGGGIRLVFENIYNINGVMVQNYQLYISALNYLNTTFGMGSLPPSIGTMDDDLSGKIVIQCSFRLMAHRLHQFYPTNIRYPKFGSIPNYIEILLNDICFNVENIQPHVSSKLMKYFFCYDNGWIKLDILKTVFPSLKFITLSQVLLNTDIFESTLSFLARHPKSIDFITIKSLDETQLTKSNAIKQYSSRFQMLNWNMFTTEYDHDGGTSALYQLGPALSNVFNNQNFTQRGFPKRGDFILLHSSNAEELPWMINGQVISHNPPK